MAGLLDGALAKAIYQGFKGKLLKATLRQANPAVSAGLDSLGDPLAADVLEWPCQGFTEAYSEFYRAQAGIPETDVRVNLFAASLNAGIKPAKDDKVQMPARTGPWYQLRKVGTDPATALWTCQAFEIPAP